MSMDGLFFIDMIVNFLAAYETSEKTIEFRLPYIAMNYLSGWFLIDLISTVPFQYFSNIGASADVTDPSTIAKAGRLLMRVLE